MEGILCFLCFTYIYRFATFLIITSTKQSLILENLSRNIPSISVNDPKHKKLVIILEYNYSI